jgi:hypothetical protein
MTNAFIPREVVEQALERMDRARRILTGGDPRPNCNWGMLDTTDLRAALAASTSPAPAVPERKKWSDLPVEGWVVLDRETREWAQHHGLSLLANPDGTFNVMQGQKFLTMCCPTAAGALDALWQTGEFPDPAVPDGGAVAWRPNGLLK